MSNKVKFTPEQKMFLVLKFRELKISLSAFCRMYNVERTAIHRWSIKYDNEGLKGLEEIKKHTKYSSYKGIIGKTPDNYIERNFEAERPNEKWFTDITEFKLKGEKLYLSVILDVYGRYVISYNIDMIPIKGTHILLTN